MLVSGKPGYARQNSRATLDAPRLAIPGFAGAQPGLEFLFDRIAPTTTGGALTSAPLALLPKAVVLVSAILALTNPAAAQDYPARPVRLVVPFPPGGSNDVVGRLIATHLAERLGNRGGAGGVIGTEVVAKSPADGYTLLVISMAPAVNPWLYKLTYDPIKDFAPVALLTKGANVLVVHPSLPVHSVKELIALAKQKPGDLQYASAGIGSFQHLGGELFELMAGVDMLHVPFKGGGPAMVDIVGVHTKGDVFFHGADGPADQAASCARSAAARSNAARRCRTCRRSRRAAATARPRGNRHHPWRALGCTAAGGACARRHGPSDSPALGAGEL
jgi:hypothetical protein